ncbi:hypothetical protein ACVJMZ_005742 [Sinorhizobium medicae]
MSRVGAAPNPVVGKHVLSIRLPYRLGACFREEADPDKNIVPISTKGMARANAIERKVAKKTIQIRIVCRFLTEDHWNIGVEALR